MFKSKFLLLINWQLCLIFGLDIAYFIDLLFIRLLMGLFG